MRRRFALTNFFSREWELKNGFFLIYCFYGIGRESAGMISGTHQTADQAQDAPK